MRRNDTSPARPFEVICEVDPPVTPDLAPIREQFAVLAPAADAFLIPDNHLGRPRISNLVVAREALGPGARSIVCINARDRNLLAFQRDVLSAAACRVNELLLVYGDEPDPGERSSLTVRRMLSAAREAGWRQRLYVTADANRPLPKWKREADGVFLQVSHHHDVDRWRTQADFNGSVHAGVIVLASAGMARRLMGIIPGYHVAAQVMDRLERDPNLGVELALEQVDRLRAAGAVDGVHLIPGRRYAAVAEALAVAGSSRSRHAALPGRVDLPAPSTA